MTSPISSSLSSPGIGSGLDVNSIVSQLVASARAGDDSRLSGQLSTDNTQISALGSLKSVLAGLQTAAASLGASGSVAQSTASSADSTVFTATASGSVQPGSYNVEVVSLATAAKIASDAYASPDTVVGDGSVTVALGSKSFTVNLASGNDSLSDLVSAINQAKDNPGVSASIITDTNGAHLVLQSQVTGGDNALTLSSASAADSSSFINTSSLQTAASAHLRVDGYDVYSDSNVVDSAISGVTLNLVKAQPGSAVGLTLAPNQQAATAAVQSFVAAYNKVVTAVAQLTVFDPTGQNSGPLIGDNTINGIANQLRSVLGNQASGTGSAYTLLSQIGITTNTDGTLVVDSGKLGTAVSSNLASVQKMFSGTGGFATQLSPVLDSYLQSGGAIDAETTSLQAQVKDIQNQQDQLNTRMTALTAQYTQQFSGLDTLIASMKSTSDYLTQQLANLPGFGGSSSKN
ncbi:MAG: flagellar filament capping protein FliD [Stenotrophobium sp.]